VEAVWRTYCPISCRRLRRSSWISACVYYLLKLCYHAFAFLVHSRPRMSASWLCPAIHPTPCSPRLANDGQSTMFYGLCTEWATSWTVRPPRISRVARRPKAETQECQYRVVFEIFADKVPKTAEKYALTMIRTKTTSKSGYPDELAILRF